MIPLDQSWTIEDVPLKSQPKPATFGSLGGAALWPSAAGDSFYSYNGGLSYATQIYDKQDPKENTLWEFVPGTNGIGTWTLQAPSPDGNFTNLSRTRDALQTGYNGLGFAVGGLQMASTDFDLGSGAMEVPGMVMYNDSTQQWWNVSTTGYSYDGTAQGGAAVFVPSFGPEGLLFVLGGFANGALASFDYVFMFEPLSQQWRKQQVSGTPPAPVGAPCAVGVPGDEGTYEVSHGSFPPTPRLFHHHLSHKEASAVLDTNRDARSRSSSTAAAPPTSRPPSPKEPSTPSPSPPSTGSATPQPPSAAATPTPATSPPPPRTKITAKC